MRRPVVISHVINNRLLLDYIDFSFSIITMSATVTDYSQSTVIWNKIIKKIIQMAKFGKITNCKNEKVCEEI